MMRGRLSHVAAVVLVVCAVCAAGGASEAQDKGARQTPEQAGGAQSTSPREGAEGAAAVEDANQDLSITARVTARELLFRKVPNPRVEFTGRPRRETVWESERQNLPEQVQPGVTYRDIGITLRITSIFPDIDRIVAEALGEIPPSDDSAPADAPPPTRQQTTPSASDAPPDAPPSTTETRRPPSPKGRGK